MTIFVRNDSFRLEITIGIYGFLIHRKKYDAQKPTILNKFIIAGFICGC